MEPSTLAAAYRECIEFWRRGDVERARDRLLRIPASGSGPANQALRHKLESLLSSGSLQALTRPRNGLDAGSVAVPEIRSAVDDAEFRVQSAAPRTAAGTELPLSSVLVADRREPRAGVTLVAACMNRQHNFLKVLPSWLATDADEIVVVDWSSNEPLWPLLRGIGDPRLKVVRIDGEARWILTHALNVGLRVASREVIYKLDCDIEVEPDFIAANRIEEGEFVRGFWKLAMDAGKPDQRYINGTFGAFKADLRAIGYYDERIVTYGWDDSDLYSRLAMDRGLAGKLIKFATLRHIEQDERQRLENQDVAAQALLGRFEPTELEGAKNKYLSSMSPTWGARFYAQDFVLSSSEPGLLRGRRTTSHLARQQGIEPLATTVAVRQLLLWAAGETLPRLPEAISGRLDFSQLISDAHRRGASERLVAHLSALQGVHFVRVADPALQPAVERTLALIADHEPSVLALSVIVERAVQLGVGDALATRTHFVAPGELVEALAQACGAVPLADAGSLEATLRHGATACTCTTVSFDLLVDEVLRKASRFAADLAPRFEDTAVPAPGSAMVTSLYDEPNLIRLVEYLTCVVLNLRVFERVLVCYESRDGVLHALLRRIATRLALPVGRLVILPYDSRPTFEELFAVQRLVPVGTRFAVANADIAFDASFGLFERIDLSSTVAALSRWNVIDGGRGAALIRLEDGSPNTFSADAWITTTPFEPDFFLDYPIGTMHCDSFINNQISLSARYRVINPCFDVKIFHLHDERFNSSAQKQVRDSKEIQERYGVERARNGGNDPVKGVGWSTLASAASSDRRAVHLQQWRPKVLELDMAAAGAQLGGLLLLHLMRSLLVTQRDLVVLVRLREKDIRGVVGSMLAKYQSFFETDNLLLDIEDRSIDAAMAEAQGTFIRRLAVGELLDCLIDSDHEAFTREMYEVIRWPAIAGIKLFRAEAKIDLDSASHYDLIAALAKRHAWVLESFLEFSASLTAGSPERTLLQPFLPDLSPTRRSAQRGTRNVSPRVSFVTSLYNGADFLPGYLENVLLAAMEVGGEVIVVDANADEADGLIVRQFMEKNASAAKLIEYIRLDHDPGLYNCWRLAIEMSRAPLITNANIDDRRSPWHTVELVEFLEQHPEFAGACGSISCVTTESRGSWFSLAENQVWFHDEGMHKIGLPNLYVCEENGEVRSRNVMHCMPVWRKSLHDHFGYFDEERYGTSADWAFWLKCSAAGEEFFLKPSAFGRYYLNPHSHNRRNDASGTKELRIIEDFLGTKQMSLVKQ